MEYNISSVSFTLNAIQAKNIKYCVMKIDNIFPLFVLKNKLLAKLGQNVVAGESLIAVK